MRLAALVLTVPCLLGPPDFAGRWEGELLLRQADGTTTQQQAHLVIRQYGDQIEGAFGYNRDVLTRIKGARADGEMLTLSVSAITMTLRLHGERLEGDVRFPGAEAPVTTASFRRSERGNGGVPGPERPSAVGDIRRLESFRMPQLDRSRRVLVYLPPDYERSSARYPVIYMNDGQNLFDVTTSDRGEWQVDETLERLFATGRSRGLIVVGVEHGGPLRALEYMPAALGIVPRAEGERYAEFVAKTLKPYIDAHYRTLPGRDHTAVVGASAGAQIAFHIGTEYAESFSKIGALGFVMGRGARENIAEWANAHRKRSPMKVYLHVGTEENLGTPADNRLFVENLKAQRDALRRAGYLDSEVKLDLEDGAHHIEAFWGKRFERVVEWLFGGTAEGR